MATHTVNIDVVDKTIPIGNNRVIPVINQPNPALGYAASANEVAQLLRLANYYVYEAGTDTIINPYNYYDYFPEAGGGGGGGGGVTPQTVQSMIDASIDSTVSDTSTKAVQNAAITNFVNSSIESSTAEFKGTYDSKVEMDAVTANQNDYAFLCVLNNDGSVNHYERYKWSDTEVSGSHWLFEYNVNNSSFTAEQWAAINSGIKDTDVSALGGHVNNTNNPHGVTKSQVGLSDVDNTSDADKPISTATQTALNTKFDTAGTGLNKNGTTVSHATPEGAATHAKAFYKFSTDALGHVNGVTEATEAEVNAIDSGITAAKVGQIETNKNNILLSYNLDGQHNLLPLQNGVYSASTSTFTITDGVITLKSVDTSTHAVTVGSFMMKAGTYVLFNRYTSTGNGDVRLIKGNTSITTGNPATFTLDEDASITIQSYTYNAIAESSIQPMLVTKAQYDAGLRDFQPYALPNTTITPALQECVDNGAKNEFYFGRVENGNNGSCSLNGDTITVTGTAPWAQARCYFNVRESGEYTVSVKVTSLTTQKGAINIQDVTTSTVASGGISISATGTYTLNVTLDSTHDYWLTLMVNNTASTISSSNIVFTDIMLCKSELYKVSPTVEPYAMSNAELTAAEKQNESNILSVADQSTRYNLINLHDPIFVRNVVPTYLSEGGVTLDVNNVTWTAFNINYPSIVGIKYKFVVRITATTGLSNFHVFIRDTDSEGTNVAEYPTGINNATINSVGTHVFEFTATATTMWIGFYPNNSSTAVTGSVTMKAQVIEKSLYDAGFTDYQPYALPNATITPALKECVNNGAKNLLNFSGSTPIAPPNCTMTDNGDGTFTVTKTSATLDIPYIAAQLKAGTYMYSGCPAGGSDSTYRLDIRTPTGNVVGDGDYGNGVKITIPSDGWYRITCRLNSTYTTTGITIKPMLCDPALWAVSHKFEPYIKSNAELTAAVLPTGYTTPTSATGIFLQSGGYCMIGNICVVCLRFSDSSAIAANTVIFSDLPMPVKDSTIAADRILIAVANNKNIEMNITSSGDIRLGGTALSGANDIITAFVAYLAQS